MDPGGYRLMAGEDAHLEAAYEDANGGEVDTAVDYDEIYEGFYPDEEGGGCIGPCVSMSDHFLATCIHCGHPMN